jgi:hypothetical protein
VDGERFLLLMQGSEGELAGAVTTPEKWGLSGNLAEV